MAQLGFVLLLMAFLWLPCKAITAINYEAPTSFLRIGYYDTCTLDRTCLHLAAKDANPNGAYSHINWAYASIDISAWTITINDHKDQWFDFKALPNTKRIVSVGGWTDSGASWKALADGILLNANTFALNIAKFVEDENIDGVEIDWESPGAPQACAYDTDFFKQNAGSYKNFLSLLKGHFVGSNRTLSLAVSAHPKYLDNFPLASVAETIDFISLMTYNLHGQWDSNNPRVLDCPSGKCIRSHVNLTEIESTLSKVKILGIPNNKIVVNEASFGRSLHMAVPDCWQAQCEFTGSENQPEASPGVCTGTPGFMSLAEIDEIVSSKRDTASFHDNSSDTDVVLYKGDYIAYLSGKTKQTRRELWQKSGYAGTADWAIDLQPVVCTSGMDISHESGGLCARSCAIGYCPEPLCRCLAKGYADPPVGIYAEGRNNSNTQLNGLCQIACGNGFCNTDVCSVYNGSVPTPVDPHDSPIQGPPTSNTPTSRGSTSRLPVPGIPVTSGPSSLGTTLNTSASNTPTSDEPVSNPRTSSTPESGTPTPRTSESNTSTSDAPTSGISASNITLPTSPTSSSPPSDRPTTKTSTLSISMSNAPMSTTSKTNSPTSEASVSSTRMSNTTISDTPSSETPTAHTTSTETARSENAPSAMPASSTSQFSISQSSTPLSSTPASDASSSSSPMSDTPSLTSGTPASDTPIFGTPTSADSRSDTALFNTTTSNVSLSSSPMSDTATQIAGISTSTISTSDNSVSGTPVSGIPQSSTSLSSTTTSDASSSRTPTSDTSVSEPSTSSAQTSYTPTSGTLASNTAISSMSVSDTPAAITTASETFISTSPTSNTPTPKSPTSDSPISHNPISDSLITSSLTAISPTFISLTSDSPTSDNPTSNGPIPISLTSISSTSDSPSSNSPTSSSASSVTPASSTPASSTPTSGMPTFTITVGDTPTPEAPIFISPTPKTPVSDSPTSSTPTSDTPTDDTPTDDPPTDDDPSPGPPIPVFPFPSIPLPGIPVPSIPLPNIPIPTIPAPNTPTPKIPTTDGPLASKAPKPPRKSKVSSEGPCKFEGISTQRIAAKGYSNTILLNSCSDDRTYVTEMVITKVSYAPDATSSQVSGTCKEKWSQACYFYSAAIRASPHWSTLTCPDEAGEPGWRANGRATAIWNNEHDISWRRQKPEGGDVKCDMDEYPPAGLLSNNDPAIVLGGSAPKGQLMRYLPFDENRGAGSMWKGACFKGPVAELTDKEFIDRLEKDLKHISQKLNEFTTQIRGSVWVDQRPEFTIVSWGHHHPPRPVYAADDGLWVNPCWDSKKAPNDPGYAVLSIDPFYSSHDHLYDYKKPYVPPVNPARRTAAAHLARRTAANNLAQPTAA